MKALCNVLYAHMHLCRGEEGEMDAEAIQLLEEANMPLETLLEKYAPRPRTDEEAELDGEEGAYACFLCLWSVFLREKFCICTMYNVQCACVRIYLYLRKPVVVFSKM